MTIPKTTTEIDSKLCTKCGADKPIDQYQTSSVNKDGRVGMCHSCMKAYKHSYYMKNRERLARLHVEYVRTHKDEIARYQAQYSIDNAPLIKEKRAEYKRSSHGKDMRIAYQRRHPEKMAARNSMTLALKRGDLTRPDSCSSCGEGGRIEGHHWSYLKEHQLDVVWLCVACHATEHKRLKKEGK